LLLLLAHHSVSKQRKHYWCRPMA